MKIDDMVVINKYGQDLIEIDKLQENFLSYDLIEKRDYLTGLKGLIGQSKPKDSDIEPAILESGLKPTYTPCVLLKKGVATHNLNKIIELPENELEKALFLFLSLFRIAYKRRFAIEKNNPDKWWYWDLSDETNISKISQNG